MQIAICSGLSNWKLGQHKGITLIISPALKPVNGLGQGQDRSRLEIVSSQMGFYTSVTPVTMLASHYVQEVEQQQSTTGLFASFG